MEKLWSLVERDGRERSVEAFPLLVYSCFNVDEALEIVLVVCSLSSVNYTVGEEQICY